MKAGFCFIFILLLVCLTETNAGSNLNVVVSIKPFHSLVSGIMLGVSRPVLLLNGKISPHAYSLRPSDAAKLQKADLVIWGGETFESFLAKPIRSLAKKAKQVSVQETPGLKLWPVVTGNDSIKSGQTTNQKNDDSSEHRHDMSSVADPHIWLDPYNAKVIAQNIVRILSDLDPVNEQIYHSNGEITVSRLDELDQQLITEMNEISDQGYLVFHNAYQYFERRYRLNTFGSLTYQMGHALSVSRLREVQKTIKINQIRCIFTEPQYPQKLVQTLIEGTSMKIGSLDPIGYDIHPGPELYFILLKNLSLSLRSCLD